MIESLPLIIDAGGGGGAKLARASVLDMPTAIGNVNDLPQALTIGGTAYAPCAYLVADDINPTTGAWASRHDASKALAVTGAGAEPTYAQVTAIENTAVKYAAVKYHAAADTTWGQLASVDFALGATFSVPDNGTHNIVATSSAITTTKGLLLQIANNIGYFYIGQTGSYAAMNTAAASIPSGCLCDLLILGDRSEKMYLYLNGIYATSADISTKTETLTNANMVVGAYGATITSPTIITLSLYSLTGDPFPGAATNRAVMDAIAAERFETISGIYDRKRTAYSYVRTSSAYLDKYIDSSTRRLFAVSSGWPRVIDRMDNTLVRSTEYLSEVQATNEFTYSEDATQGAGVSRLAVGTNATGAPTGNTTADALIASEDDNTHRFRKAATSGDAVHIMSAWCKAGNKNWIKFDSASVGNATAFFDLSTGVLGTVGAAATAGIEGWGNGWYRCWMAYTGGAAEHQHDWYPADADGDINFVGDAVTANVYIWGMQHEAGGTVLPTSYIYTAAAAATRIKDSLTRTIAITTGKITIDFETLLGANHDNTLAKTMVMLDDGSTNNVIDATVTAADVSVLTVTTGGGAQAAVTGSQNFTNGRRHRVIEKAKTNYVAQSVNGVADGTVDTEATTSASYTVCRIGCSGAGLTLQPCGTIGKLKVYKDVL